MSVGEDAFDQLAHALVAVEYDFDAVEHEGLRAEWSDDGTTVIVVDTGTDERHTYVAEDLMIATSDREVKKARHQSEPP